MMLLLLASHVVCIANATHPTRADFFKKHNITLIDKEDTRVQTKTVGDDKFVSNMKPLLVDDKLKFLDEENFQKACAVGKRLKRKQVLLQMVQRQAMSSKCFGGKSTFSSKLEKQNAFRKSSCLPIMLVPGIMGTRLKVILDCSKLSSDVNKQCEDTCRNYNQS